MAFVRSCWPGARWLVAMALVVSACGVVIDFLIAECCAEQSSELVLKTVAARVAAGVDGRPVSRVAVVPVRTRHDPAATIRYVVRTSGGDVVAGDPTLVSDRAAGRVADDTNQRQPSTSHAFTEVFGRGAQTFVVTVAETDARHGATVWSLFRRLLVPAFSLPVAFALFAWLVVRDELRSPRAHTR